MNLRTIELLLLPALTAFCAAIFILSDSGLTIARQNALVGGACPHEQCVETTTTCRNAYQVCGPTPPQIPPGSACVHHCENDNIVFYKRCRLVTQDPPETKCTGNGAHLECGVKYMGICDTATPSLGCLGASADGACSDIIQQCTGVLPC